MKHPTKGKSPVIILGMHRSGTSMIARMLEAIGVFQGTHKDPNHEPYTFLEINDWLMSTVGATWDHPERFSLLVNDDSLRDDIVNCVRGYLAGRAGRRFCGIMAWLGGESLQRMHRDWGWKDPRNSYTLPIWLSVFPAARILSIERHGVDVADSLVRRERRNRESARVHMDAVRSGQPATGLPRIYGSYRVSSMDGAFSLWAEYMENVRTILERVERPKHELRYEDFLAAPLHELRRLASFIGLELPDKQLEQVARQGNAERSYSYRGQPELIRYAERHADVLQRFGYTP